MKFSSKFAHFALKCHVNHIQKENVENVDICYGKERPKDEKMLEKWDDPLPLRPHTSRF